MAVAVRYGSHWHVTSPEPVGTTVDLFQRLTGCAEAAGPLLVGFDFPIGLSEEYGIRTGFRGFKEALQNFGTGEWSQWYSVAEKSDQIDLKRPFYPLRPGGTKRAHLLDGLGVEGTADLLRLCERATDERQAACMLFWTLGGNQVGRAAISGWQELLVPNLEKFGLWPFDGSLSELLALRPVVVVETYPGEVYGHLGIARRPVWSKRKREGRRKVGKHLLNWFDRYNVLDADVRGIIEDGFGDRSEAEDQFDAVAGLLGMLDVVEGRRGDGAPSTVKVTNWEGWIFGQQA